MRFLYATDLHGDVSKYEIVLRHALESGIKYIHLGADILPKGTGLLGLQKKFVKGYLRSFYERCAEEGIKVLTMFGNDDIYTRKKYFKKYGKLLDEEPEQIEGYTFTGYPYVPDYPFGLVSACKYDHAGWSPEPYYGRKLEVDETGFVDIPDKLQYFKDKGTIEEDLSKISADNKTIAAIHCPPHALELDVCMNGLRVGSKAIYDWIEREQPYMVLCGHIHENYYKTKRWKAKIGNTIVIQPGQETNKTHIVLVELEKEECHTHLLELRNKIL
jgi:uncharacterized protein